MAHEITRSKTTGRHLYFEAKNNDEALVVTAWHSLGTPVKRGISLDDAVETIEANFPVEKRPTYRVVTRNGVQVVEECKKAFVTVRTDTEAELGGVGPQYEPLQNRDAFAPIEPLLDSGILTLETGAVLRGGEDVFVMGRFETDALGKLTREFYAENGMLAHALWSNNHSGRKNATVSTIDTKVVCANTHKAAEDEMRRSGKYVAVRHSGDVAARFDEATQQMFGMLQHRYEVVSAHYLRMKAATMTEAEFGKAVLDAIVPPRKIEDGDKTTRTANLLEKDETKRKAVRNLWENGIEHTGDHSAWEAWNAATQAIDHNEAGLFESRDRLVSMYDGTVQRVKEKVYSNILDMVSVPTSIIDNILRVHYDAPTATLIDQILAATRDN